jgi:epoxyqueuosine reductase QueG
MKTTDPPAGSWLTAWMRENGIDLWGVADLKGFSTPRDGDGRGFPYALSWAVPVEPQIMAGIERGPNQAYAEEYARVNRRINELSQKLAAEIKDRDYRARCLAASDRTDRVNIKGDFPHKTAATRAGLGWVGRNCQLVTRQLGPWIRLGTVFTDMELACGPPVERSDCGGCVRCVEACPAGALTGKAWAPGAPRQDILDAVACDRWKKEHYYEYHQGHNCGICAAVCPYGQKTLRVHFRANRS